MLGMLHHRCQCLLRSVLLVMTVGSVVTAKADKNNKIYIHVGRYAGASGACLRSAIAEWDKGNVGGARNLLDAAIKADNQFWPAYLMRAQAWMQFGKYHLALQDCNSAARLKPQFTRIFVVRADIYRALGRCAEALADLNQVIKIRETRQSTALALSTRAVLRLDCWDTANERKQALKDAAQAYKMDGRAVYLDILAIAYAANGDFDSAIQSEKKAIATGRLDADELKRVQTRLASFEQRKVP